MQFDRNTDFTTETLRSEAAIRKEDWPQSTQRRNIELEFHGQV